MTRNVPENPPHCGVSAALSSSVERGDLNAGHNPQYILRAQGTVERLTSTGLPIGLFAGHGYKESFISLAPGDLLFFFTDGLVEAENDRGDAFGPERLESILEQEHSGGIDAVLERLDQEINAFRGKAEPLDDATMMALRVRGARCDAQGV